MASRDLIEKKAEEIVRPIVESNGFELWDVEYVKEGSEKYLRAYIDKEGGITINDCELVSRAFSEKLDEDDFIKEAYILEVSSPGLTRPLKKDKDFDRSIGKLVEAGTFAKIDKRKEFLGRLVAFDDSTVTLDDEGTEIVLPRKQLSYIRLAFEF